MAKKILEGNPALDFFSYPDTGIQDIEKEAGKEEKAQNGQSLYPVADNTNNKERQKSAIVPMKPVYIETKSRRCQLLMQPSIYNEIERQAKAENTSVNNYIHAVLEEHIKMKR